MDEFNTKEKVEELFKSVDGLGENNCIFLCFIDTNREGLKYGALGALGAVGGGAIAGVAAFSSGIVDGMTTFSPEIPLTPVRIKFCLSKVAVIEFGVSETN